MTDSFDFILTQQEYPTSPPTAEMAAVGGEIVKLAAEAVAVEVV